MVLLKKINDKGMESWIIRMGTLMKGSLKKMQNGVREFLNKKIKSPTKDNFSMTKNKGSSLLVSKMVIAIKDAWKMIKFKEKEFRKKK